MTHLQLSSLFVECHPRRCVIAASLLALFAALSAAPANEPTADAIANARAVRVLLRDHCAECHGGAKPEQDLSILNYDDLLAGSYVIPKDVENSMIWQKIHDPKEPMPPEKKGKPLSDAEKKILRSWIEAGAPAFPTDEHRKYISEEAVLSKIVDDLQKIEPADRPYIRYVSLVNLYNNSFEKRIGANSKNVDEDELNYARAAFSLLMNSLSWKRDISVPKAIDTEGVTYRIDLRDYDWLVADWVAAIATPGALYPYGIDFENQQNKSLAAVARRHYELRHGDDPKARMIPYVRIDWFINTASRGDLYNRLLKLPGNVKSLERILEVDSESNFLRHQIDRAGMIKSGVSQNHRLVERHATKFGAYWKSFDFGGRGGARDLLTHPLGPEFPDNPFGQYAFEEDGGEMIFNLPNGLQAYFLVGKDGNRINEGPTKIVEDKLGASGSVVVENAISCFACHDKGMKTFTDVVLKNRTFTGREQQAIENLFPPSEKMDSIVKKDAERFQQSVRAAIAPWYPNGATVEPVSVVAKKYQREIQLEEAAVECGLRDLDAFATRIRQDGSLRREIGPLADGGEIKRADWEQKGFKKVVRKIEAGVPVEL